jgi:hypothetical protein
LKIFGAIELSRRQYHKVLAEALIGEADFARLASDGSVSGEDALAHAVKAS